MTQDKVTVTQADREFYQELCFSFSQQFEADTLGLIARHRLAAQAEIEALRARVAELDAENVKLKGSNRTHVKSAFFEGFDAARQVNRSDAWEESATRHRIDYPATTLGAKP